MKKVYKLKKWYPSLPKRFMVGMHVTYYSVDNSYSDSPAVMKSTVDLDPEEVENNSEFWEKVSENEVKYEIIRFHDGYNEYYKTSNGEFTINLQYMYKEEDLLKKMDVRIQSVKRLSDGTVFTVGEEAKTITSWGHHKIRGFSFETKSGSSEKNLWVQWEINQGGNWLDKIEHYLPLFTSVDGKEIYKGDGFYVVDTKFFKLQKTYGGQFQNEKWKNQRYADKENAKEFISQNKPCLSVKDILTTVNLGLGMADKLRFLVIKKSEL